METVAVVAVSSLALSATIAASAVSSAATIAASRVSSAVSFSASSLLYHIREIREKAKKISKKKH